MYVRTATVPTSLFPSPENWGDAALNKRIERAAFGLVLLLESGFARQPRDESWQSCQHEFGSAADTELDIDLNSDLMHLATSSRLRPRTAEPPRAAGLLRQRRLQAPDRVDAGPWASCASVDPHATLVAPAVSHHPSGDARAGLCRLAMGSLFSWLSRRGR